MGSFDIGPWLIIVFLVYCGWRFLNRNRSTPSSNVPSRRTSSQRGHQSDAYHWENDGFRDVEVVGESNYQTHLKRLVGTPSDNGVEVDCIATLVPEPSNPHDPNAVRVDIDGGTVGYLSKANAVAFHKRLAKVGQAGNVTSCAAKIFGGKKDGGRRAAYGVWLELKRL